MGIKGEEIDTEKYGRVKVQFHWDRYGKADEKVSYRTSLKNGVWAVQDESGRVVMACRDERSATDYTVLLNEAYRRGYKAGYRDSRKPG